MKRRDFFRVLSVAGAALVIPGVAEARDHGNLEGLADDDHIQYPYWTQEITDNVNFLLGKLDYINPDVFATGDQVHFLERALSLFNETPPFTDVGFHNTKPIRFWGTQIAKCAAILMLVKVHYVERGDDRDITLSMIYTSPYSSVFDEWWECVKARKRVVLELMRKRLMREF